MEKTVKSSRRLAICAVLKNEARIVAEWLTYHRLIGVEKFFLYDNNSTDNILEILTPFISMGLVEYRPWPINPGQLEAYDHYVNTHMGEFEWTAFIDLDEFLRLSAGKSLADWLDSFPVAAGVALHWLNFGPAGQDEPPAGLVISAYDRRLPAESPVHGHIKTIVRTANYRLPYTPHAFEVVGPVVNERGQVVNAHGGDYSILPASSHESAWINHYYTRSRREWREKVARGMADSAIDAPNRRSLEWLDHYERDAIVEDNRLRAYAADVERVLAESASVPAMSPPVFPMIRGPSNGGRLAISTAHGAMLAIDPIGQLTQVSMSDERRAHIITGDDAGELHRLLQTCLAGSAIVTLGQEAFAVQRNGRYLCALNNGGLVLNRENVASWETFVVRGAPAT